MDRIIRSMILIITFALFACVLVIGRQLDTNSISADRQENAVPTSASSEVMETTTHSNYTEPSTTPSMVEEYTESQQIVDAASDYRFIVFSDVHYKETASSVAESDARMKLLVDTINAEHKKRPVQFCIFNGDMAIGYNKSSIQAFAQKWANQFDMPVYWFPGDHDDVTDETWVTLFQNHRQASMEDAHFYFIWMDVYADSDDDGKESSGVRTSKVIDTAWVEQEISKAGSKPVILLTHYVYSDAWYPDVANLLDDYPEIVAVISSHSHDNSVGTICANQAAFIQTGNFSYPNGADWSKKGENNEHLWGFANFEMENGGLFHWYIQPAHHYENIGVDLPYTEGEKHLIWRQE